MDAIKLALTITAADLAKDAISSVRRRVRGLGDDAAHVKKAYADMEKFVGKGLAGFGTAFLIGKTLKPGVDAASSLQAEVIGIQAELGGSVKSAAELSSVIGDLKKNAFEIQGWTPFDMSQIVALEKELIKAGAEVSHVVGKAGAAAASAALGVYEKMDPVEAGQSLINIATPFKIGGDGFMSLADSIARAASASTVGAAQIVATAKYAAPAAADLKMPVEEMLTLSAVMAQGGIVADQAGTSMRSFFGKAVQVEWLKDTNGSLLKTNDLIKVLRENFKGMGDAERLAKLQDLFGEQGYSVALAMLREGKNSYEDITRAQKESLSLQEKLRLSMGGFNQQITSLKGNWSSTLSLMFEPMLAPLTAVVSKTNEWLAALGKVAAENKAVSGTVATVGAAAAGAAALYGTYQLARGGLSGLKALRGFRGLAGRASGIAEGKAIEAATGVQPVFVTNWADMGGGSSAEAAGAAAAATSVADKIIKTGKLGKLAGMASKAGVWGAAGAAALGTGYAVGSVVNDKLIDGTKFGDTIGLVLNAMAAMAGNEDAQEAINMRKAARASTRAPFMAAQNALQASVAPQSQHVAGEIFVRFDKNGIPHVAGLRSQGGLDIGVDTGYVMRGAS